MISKKVIKYVSFLLILISFCLLIPSISSNEDGFICRADYSKTLLEASNFHGDTAIFYHDNRGSLFKVSNAKPQGLFESAVLYPYSLGRFLFKQDFTADSRQKIGNIISSYFHGSKYISQAR